MDLCRVGWGVESFYWNYYWNYDRDDCEEGADWTPIPMVETQPDEQTSTIGSPTIDTMTRELKQRWRNNNDGDGSKLPEG
mmetsp:Transcript_19164/g.28384  ORF Transcript_19164/g.28384 Transcript_19164/m.28384 type:complete len:80 (+) Transcript_19164:59-298(+)